MSIDHSDVLKAFGEGIDLSKAGPYIGPRGGKWADQAHTIPWGEQKPSGKTPAAKFKVGDKVTYPTAEQGAHQVGTVESLSSDGKYAMVDFGTGSTERIVLDRLESPTASGGSRSDTHKPSRSELKGMTDATIRSGLNRQLNLFRFAEKKGDRKQANLHNEIHRLLNHERERREKGPEKDSTTGSAREPKEMAFLLAGWAKKKPKASKKEIQAMAERSYDRTHSAVKKSLNPEVPRLRPPSEDAMVPVAESPEDSLRRTMRPPDPYTEAEMVWAARQVVSKAIQSDLARREAASGLGQALASVPSPRSKGTLPPELVKSGGRGIAALNIVAIREAAIAEIQALSQVDRRAFLALQTCDAGTLVSKALSPQAATGATNVRIEG